MPVELTIVETTLELGQTNVEVILTSASEPGPAGPGVPAGGTDGQVLTKASATDYDTAWEDATGGPGGGAPTDATYLVTAAHADLSAEVPVGATPGGELGGTWASPTVDATHSGSSHASVQAAAEATAAAALSAHETDTTSVHGIADTSSLALTANHPTNATFNDHSARHENGGADEISLAGLDGIPTELQTHLDDTTDAHDASAVSVDSTSLSGVATHVQGSLEELDNLLDDHSARHEDGGADEISIQGLAGTPVELTNHLNDASDAHDAAAISIADVGGYTTTTEVEAALQEIFERLRFKGVRLAASGVSVSNGGFPGSVVSFTTESYDTDTFHDNVTNPSRITIPAGLGGKYIVGISGAWDSDATTAARALFLRLNGSVVTGYRSGAGGADQRHVFVQEMLLSAGDYIEANPYQETGSTRTVGLVFWAEYRGA